MFLKNFLNEIALKGPADKKPFEIILFHSPITHI